MEQGTRVIVEEKTRTGRRVTHGHVTQLWLGLQEELEAVTVTGVTTEFTTIGSGIEELEGAEFERTFVVPLELVEVVS